MNVIVELHNKTKANIPCADELKHWVEMALAPKEYTQAVALCVIDRLEMQTFNHQYRDKNKPTNVLAFPNEAPPELSDGFVGDILLCAPVIEQEAQKQHKLLKAHWAHMVIHSTLHLQGYDHQTKEEAVLMESQEIAIMKELGFGNPYQEVENV